MSRLLTCMFASAWRNPASTDVVYREPEQGLTTQFRAHICAVGMGSSMPTAQT